jgi:hypothetical protein
MQSVEGPRGLSTDLFKSNAQAGYPAAPRISSLLLLPLGPDRVRRFPPRRTHLGVWNIPQVRVLVNKVLQHAAQHRVQDTAIAIVFHLDQRVKASDGFEHDLLIIFRDGAHGHLTVWLDLVVHAFDVIHLVPG